MATYLKTPKGQEEMASHAHGLGLRARRLLILIDGQRDTHALATMTADAKLQESLAQLLEGGFITLAGAQESGQAPAPGSTSASADPAARLAAKSDGHESAGAGLQLARDFMMNTLRVFHGPYGKLDLVKRIHASSQVSELRALFDEWLASISETRIGRKRADELTARLMEVLPG